MAFVEALEVGYSKHKNPYHNLIHAADVTQTAHYLMLHTGIMVSKWFWYPVRVKIRTLYVDNSYLSSFRHFIVTVLCFALSKHWLTELEILAMVFAAAIHDFEHTGTTNNFHIQTRYAYPAVSSRGSFWLP